MGFTTLRTDRVMGKYKDDNGTTRVGDLLRDLGDVGKPILEAAGSLTGRPWLNKIASSITTSKELDDQQRQAALYMHAEDLKDVQNARDNETARDSSQYSSWLSKNIHEIIAIGFCGAWVVTWFVDLPTAGEKASDAVMLILGYLYGRSKPQQ